MLEGGLPGTKGRVLPLVVIVGPTASGKTSLSINLARRFGGEIVSADSRAIYRGLDVGSAKPSKEEMLGVPHWGVDLVGPNQKYSASDFKRYAVDKISDIRRRGKVPFLVGGSGLYIDSVVFDYGFVDGLDYDSKRKQYDNMTIEELLDYCRNNNIKLPENYKNRRYLINSIVRNNIHLGKRQTPIENCLLFGIKTDKLVLRDRIKQRAEKIFSSGIIDETKSLAETYGWSNEAMTGNVYPIIRRYLKDEVSHEEAIRLFELSDWHLAKRQITWFKRNERIEWLSLDVAEEKITQKILSMLELGVYDQAS